MIDELVVEAHAESGPTGSSQGHVIARQFNPLEPVAFLEIAESAPLLFSISEIRVHQMRNSSIGTG